MFRPVQLSFGNSAGGKFCKGHSKAHKQITAVSRPAERLSQLSKQQLAVDADGTVSHSAVVAFFPGPVQMMLVHDAVQHSLRLGQQLAGDKATLPCRPQDWIEVNLPSTLTKTETDSRKMEIKTSPKQPTAVRQASSTPASSLVKSSCDDAKATDSSALSQPRFDAITVVTADQSITEPQAALVGDSSPTNTTIISGPSSSLLADVPLSPVTSSPLPAILEANSSNLCENSLACTTEEDTKWATSTWTYHDVFKVNDCPLQPSSASGPATSEAALSETKSSSATDIPRSDNCSKEVEDIIGSADAFVEVSLRPKHLTTKPLLSLASITTAKLTQVLQEPPRPDDKHKFCAESDPVACTRPTEDLHAAAECISHCTTGGNQLNMLQQFCSTVQALLGQARWLMGASTSTTAAPCCDV